MNKAAKKSTLTLVTEPKDFFMDEVARAFQKQKIKQDADIQNYLVEILSRFMFTENFFAQDENGNLKNETLALLFGQAANTNDTGKKCEDYRRLGDISLYTAGFFTDSLNRKSVDIDYYIGMGSSAYSTLANMMLDKQFRKIYTTLSDQFVKFVDVFSEISSITFASDSKNILRLYELYVKTGSTRAEKNLKDAGIVPNKKIKSNIQ